MTGYDYDEEGYDEESKLLRTIPPGISARWVKHKCKHGVLLTDLRTSPNTVQSYLTVLEMYACTGICIENSILRVNELYNVFSWWFD